MCKNESDEQRWCWVGCIYEFMKLVEDWYQAQNWQCVTYINQYYILHLYAHIQADFHPVKSFLFCIIHYQKTHQLLYLKALNRCFPFLFQSIDVTALPLLSATTFLLSLWRAYALHVRSPLFSNSSSCSVTLLWEQNWYLPVCQLQELPDASAISHSVHLWKRRKKQVDSNWDAGKENEKHKNQKPKWSG